jgi:hypothetical protein
MTYSKKIIRKPERMWDTTGGELGVGSKHIFITLFTVSSSCMLLLSSKFHLITKTLGKFLSHVKAVIAPPLGSFSILVKALTTGLGHCMHLK